MDPISAIRRAFRPGGTAADQSCSILLLERQHHFLRKEAIRHAAERAYGRSFAPGSPTHFVTQSSSTFVKLGEDSIHILQTPTPYEAKPYEVRRRGDSRQHQWRDHRGHITFEIWNSSYPMLHAYRILCPLVEELLSDRAIGVFFPRDNYFFPHDGSALDHFRRLSS